MFVPGDTSETVFRRLEQQYPKSVTKFVLCTQLIVMAPPIAASVLYFPATMHFLNEVQITDITFQFFVATSCYVAELCLYEVKTAYFGEMLGRELYKLSYLLKPALLRLYIQEQRYQLLKHFVVAIIALESSYVYGYLSQELLGIVALSICTVIAKYTTFHCALIEMANYINTIRQDSDLSWAKKISVVLCTLFLGVSGATYVYGKSKVAFEELSASHFLAVTGASLSVIPTAMLLGNSVVKLYQEGKERYGHCPLLLTVFKELIFFWFALTASAPNAYFLEDYGRTRIDPVALWMLVVIVGLTSIINKRDAIMKASDTIQTRFTSCCGYLQRGFFSIGENQPILSANTGSDSLAHHP